MKIFLAYFTVILLWATTPLAIKWSGEGPGFLFGVTSRILIGWLCMLLFLLLSRKKLLTHRKAIQTYMIVAVQMYGALLSVYWAAQFIPSGWLSVIFGLSPFVSALFAAIWLKERSLTWVKLIAYLFGLTGLAIMFSSALDLNQSAFFGIFGVLLAVSLQTGSAVWVKRISAKLPAYMQVTGGLIFAVPLYLATWLLSGADWPQHLSENSMVSIIYLGIVSTTLGFILYYYVLLHLSATSVGMIPMISPVIALLIGHYLNNEEISVKTTLGTGLILTALLFHEGVGRYYPKVK